MAKNDYMPNDDEGKAQLFIHFRDHISEHLPALNIPANDPDIAQQAKDATRFRALLDFTGSIANAAKAWTAAKNYERDGGGTAASSAVVPALPANFPAPVIPGIVKRFRALANRLKSLGTYQPPIGQALNIEGTESAPADLTTAQPKLKLTLSGNRVEVDWGWEGLGEFLDQCEIQVDRSDGKGFVFLTLDTTPGYTDTAPLPNSPTKWKYRAIYRVDDQQVGQWSAEVSVTVG